MSLIELQANGPEVLTDPFDTAGTHNCRRHAGEVGQAPC